MNGSRKVPEFTPEQKRNLTAIVWLYRGQRDRFLAFVQDYFKRHAAECAAVEQLNHAKSRRVATFDGSRGFQPTATVTGSLRDHWSFYIYSGSLRDHIRHIATTEGIHEFQRPGLRPKQPPHRGATL